MKEFTQEKNKCLEIKDDYLKVIKNMKDTQIDLFFHEDSISFKALGQKDVETNISKNALSRYDFQILDDQYDKRNKLVIPSNFLLP